MRTLDHLNLVISDSVIYTVSFFNLMTVTLVVLSAQTRNQVVQMHVSAG